MTLEEAIKEIQKVVDECPWPGTVEEHKCLLAWLKDYQTMLSKPERTAKVRCKSETVLGIEPEIGGICDNCGIWVYDGSQYCQNCGARLEWE